MKHALLLLMAVCLPASLRQTTAEEQAVGGTVTYEPPADETGVPERFQLARRTFKYQERPVDVATDWLRQSLITFPSPVKTPHERNNTVHCEYFRPTDIDKAPGVIVLHILGGDFALSQLVCVSLAREGVASLFVKMPYYGPRRQPGVARRMISKDPHETVAGMTQAVLDIRLATAWLASRDEVDEQKLGIFGISLGGITGGLVATAEPRLKNVCLVLAGGDVGRIGWESPELKETRESWERQGKTREEYFKLVKTIDPVSYGANVRGRRILMINATDDEVIPKACTQSLWQSFGKPEIQWYSGGHYSIVRHLPVVLTQSTKFFSAEPEGGSNK